MDKIINFKLNTNFEYDSCNLDKITRKFHPPILKNQSNDILPLIHADHCGPVYLESLEGFKYVLTVVDDDSGMYFSFFLKGKTLKYIRDISKV